MLRPSNDDDNVQYQMRPGSPFSSRGFIAETLEKIFKTLQNDTEIYIANDYIDNIRQIDEAETKLREVTERINNILSEKGSVYSQLKPLRQQQEQLNAKIINIDKKLLQLESTDFIKKLIKDEEEKHLNEILAARKNISLHNSESNKSSDKKIIIAERSKRIPYRNANNSDEIECQHCHALNKKDAVICDNCHRCIWVFKFYGNDKNLNVGTDLKSKTTDKNKKIKIAKICCCFIPPLLIIVLFFTFTFGSCNSQNAISEIQLVGISENVSPGSRAYIKVQGKPNTEYSITVEYKSGYSEAEGLYSKNSDNSGYISWNWKIGTKTSEGTYPVTITNEDTFAYETFYFSVK